MRSPLLKLFLGPVAFGAKALDPRSRRAFSHRARMMLRHAWLLILGAGLLAAGLAGAAFYFNARPATLTFAVPGTHGEDVHLVQAIAQQLARDRATIRLKPMTVAGPAQSAAALDAGASDLAIVRADLPMPKHGLAVAVLRQNIVVMIVPAVGSEARPAKRHKGKAKKIEKVEDLPGHRIGVVGHGSTPTNTDVLNVILRQYEIAPDKVAVVPIDGDNVRAALRKDPVDVIVVVGPAASRAIRDAIAAASSVKAAPSFLALGASEAIANHFPVYESTEIKEGVFGGKKPLPDDSVETIAFNHYIVARKALSEAQVADFTRYLFGVRAILKDEVPAIARIEKPDTDRDAAVPAHPGAAAYLDNDQKTFFDRYSDLLYWGMILIGLCGSAVTWLASYAKADERIRRMRVIDHLLGVVRAARSARTPAELERLRGDVDAVVSRTLQQAEHDAVDQPALTAFALALAQAQLAISDRRAVLAARGLPDPDESVPAGADATGRDAATADVTPLRLA